MKKINVLWAALVALLSLCPAARAQDAQQEVEKQIAKLIGDAVSNRVTARVLDTGPGVRPGAPALRNNVWASYSHSILDPDMDDKIRTNIVVGGYDRDLTDKLIAGAALSYAKTNGSDFKTWGISPYLAYRFTDAIFGIARLAYSRGETDQTDTTVTAIPGFGVSTITSSADAKSDTWSGAISINAVQPIGSFLARGRLEVGASETHTSGRVSTSGGLSDCVVVMAGFCPATFAPMRQSFSDNSSATQFVADGELGYFFMPGLYGFAGVQAGTTNKSDSYALYGRLGLEKISASGAAVQVKWERKLDDNSDFGYNSNTFTLAARFRF